ncbi:MAG: hypothetical protein J6Y53_05835 [Alphaproteobacteria bacterium]|nr:hypothetical protein [Alphaproteobacteria bacterium]
MTKLSPEELKNITGIFTFGGFRAGAVCNDQAKSMYDAFLNVAETEVGSSLLRQIYNSDDKMQVHIDHCYNSELAGSVDAIHNDSGKIVAQKLTVATNDETRLEWLMVHELTHVLQARTQGSTEITTPDPQKRFMLDRLKEAEARLNTAKFNYEVLKNSSAEKNHKHRSSFRRQERNDVLRYRSLIMDKKNEPERNAAMLSYFYRDKNWIDDYHQQNLNVANAQVHPTGIVERVSFSDVISKFQGRLRLNNSADPQDTMSIMPFIKIENMPDYKSEQVISGNSSKENMQRPILSR